MDAFDELFERGWSDVPRSADDPIYELPSLWASPDPDVRVVRSPRVLRRALAAAIWVALRGHGRFTPEGALVAVKAHYPSAERVRDASVQDVHAALHELRQAVRRVDDRGFELTGAPFCRVKSLDLGAIQIAQYSGVRAKIEVGPRDVTFSVRTVGGRLAQGRANDPVDGLVAMADVIVLDVLHDQPLRADGALASLDRGLGHLAD